MGSVKKAVSKATDAKLTNDNWQYILDVCDLVSEDPEDGGKEAMELIESRLSQKDANVILRTLSLITSLAENCGSRLQQLIASKDFTNKLYGLVKDKSVHLAVKTEVVKVVRQLSSSFKKDPSLRYMNDLYVRISKNYPHLLQDQPDVPGKYEMSHQSKLKEDKDLEEALRLSLLSHQEQERQKQANAGQASADQGEMAPSFTAASKVPSESQVSQQQVQQRSQSASLQSATPPKRVRALYDLASNEPDELAFKKGDIIVVLEQVYRDWWRGSLRGSIGIFPLNYVTPMAEPTQEEILQEQTKESELLSQKRKVDQLYYRMRDERGLREDPTQDASVNELYGTVTPLRPEIAKLIGKHARKREELLSLRQVLANAEATYNQLLDRATNVYTSPLPIQPPPRSNQRPSSNHIVPYPNE
ncbi:ESCRT-0 subunit protein hse1 [Zygosaccharomyces mellis]|uniref:Class E vacuolar protein-sorting machinery protein HSE1 n=1 Tax=Zygosaccharomyces mellis TaxID=42258 RepID=A0A4C2EDT4_9SACH|nr:ESCRT-0 subunit protein hse1 [Zygosaccharomyces mellis]